MNKPKVDVYKVLAKYGDALSAESIAASEYPDDVKRTLSWAADSGDVSTQLWAIVLRAAVPAGFLNSVAADDSPLAARMAETLGIEPADLLASEEEARLLRAGEDPLPVLIYRSRLRDDESGLLPAMRAAFAADDGFLGEGGLTTELVPGIGATQWRCYFACSLCAVLIVDPVPADEIPACAACLKFCTLG
ncbi:hypothetical protein [Sphaerisporangium aureirubrum]|uniref:Uncharacterized protein n=1 Tax=Sphaerisporangium aureirubrum TaxID=1544736 RepID=A0ABW1NE37_9ACTN